MPWDPRRYEAFADARLRPLLDLLARIPGPESGWLPGRIADLGCGSGNGTRLLAQRWPGAHVVGVDNSPEMLETARSRGGSVEWQQAELGGWRPREPFDLLFSNAALHWLDHHDRLFPGLLETLAPHGMLAVQMPRNFDAASHRAAFQLAQEAPYSEYLLASLRTRPVLEPRDYYALLAPHCAALDIWETEYLQLLKGENPVADWTRSTLMVPLLDALPLALRPSFEAEYRRRVAAAYARSPDGTTLYSFRRLFMTVRAR
jgi:trans-aconitate 2-methyltransferase